METPHPIRLTWDIVKITSEATVDSATQGMIIEANIAIMNIQPIVINFLRMRLAHGRYAVQK